MSTNEQKPKSHREVAINSISQGFNLIRETEAGKSMTTEEILETVITAGMRKV